MLLKQPITSLQATNARAFVKRYLATFLDHRARALNRQGVSHFLPDIVRAVASVFHNLTTKPEQDTEEKLSRDISTVIAEHWQEAFDLLVDTLSTRAFKRKIRVHATTWIAPHLCLQSL
jgi:DNA topoisomerase VI subunit B